ncbi:unnamed protein product [Kuraishia capsulata CBS 1993]|uniref:C2H2-type domain-containing protein n=1 Tax=Kuraishia capsulata CBS 1993 TaxID=1382522 RepID=W6MJT1_9ASCO|nr:uncharacterized protein KUCA_T00002503001 [Kuraishia capsulata CBS 1993]CDK26531.1 unnamed protein product [Kuraishia capsulata CBS 1993]
MTVQRHFCDHPGCQKSFSHRSHLNRHLINHTAVRPFLCEECGKGYKRSDVLKTHYRKVHPHVHISDGDADGLVTVEPSTPNAARSNEEGDLSEMVALDESSEKPQLQYQQVPPEAVYVDRKESFNFSPSQLSDPEDFRGIATGMFQDNDLSWLFVPSSAAPLQGSLETDNEADNTFKKPFTPFTVNFVDSVLEAANVPRTLEFDYDVNAEIPLELSWQNERQKWTRISINLHQSISSTLNRIPPTQAELFFSPESIRKNFDLYFTTFHDHFPILHKPTFFNTPETIPPLLLTAVLTLGALKDTEDNYQTAVKIHEELIWKVFSHSDLIPSKLWIIQTLALIQAFAKMGSTRHQHEISATFHSAIITILKRDGSCTNMRSSKSKRQAHLSPQQKWELWIEQESIKRVVFLIFVMDAQHSVLFGHVSSLSVSEIRLELPCQEDLWELSDVSIWQKRLDTLNAETKKPLLFLDVLKGLMDDRSLPVTLSSFSKLVILHGLLNVIWSILREEKEPFVIVNPEYAQKASVQLRRKTILARAIETWSYSLLSRMPSKAIEACRSLYRISYLTLYTSKTSILEILAFCGSPSLTGRPLANKDRYKAFVSVERWAESPEATQCVVHALLLIQHITLVGEGSAASASSSTNGKYQAYKDAIVFRPWCLYISTLVVWSYCFFANGKQLSAVVDSDQHYPAAEQFLIDLLRSLLRRLRAGPNEKTELSLDLSHCRSLVKVVRESLQGCRWEMLSDAYFSLGELLTVVGQKSPTDIAKS